MGAVGEGRLGGFGDGEEGWSDFGGGTAPMG